MRSRATTRAPHDGQDLERAAWFARLAFGNPGVDPGQPAAPMPIARNFQVMP